MHLLVHYFAVSDGKRVEVDSLVERENGIADVGVEGQPEVFHRGARGRCRMTVPVGQNLQTLASGIFQRGKLVAGRKGEMLRRMVDVLHPIY